MGYNNSINEMYEWCKAISIEELYKFEKQLQDEFIKNFIKEVIKLKQNKNIDNREVDILKDNSKVSKWLILTTKKSLVNFCYDLSNEDESENEILINLKSLDRNNILEIHIVKELDCFSKKPKCIYNNLEKFTERINILVN